MLVVATADRGGDEDEGGDGCAGGDEGGGEVGGEECSGELRGIRLGDDGRETGSVDGGRILFLA